MDDVKPRLLDIFCGAGGATKGYQRAGFYVIGVDINPQPRYCGDEFYQIDAMRVLNGGTLGASPIFHCNAIHASPPCQGYCAMKTMTNSREHPMLIEAVRDALNATGKPWIMENVFGAPLINPLMLCGSHFNLVSSDGYHLRRHRYFETNFMVLNGQHCRHGAKTVGVYGDKARDIALEKRHYSKPKETRGKPVGVVLRKKTAFEAMGIDWMNMHELSESIPPAYTEFIGRQLLGTVKRIKSVDEA